jgi:lipopolysaccharide/colanic/teichoic acid biosynthesis glycosyltransferase
MPNMKEQILDHASLAAQRADIYFRNPDTTLARTLRKISAKEGWEYRTDGTKVAIEMKLAKLARVVAAPVRAGLEKAIYLQDGSDPIYHAKRFDRDGNIFGMKKLRSLRDGADQNHAENLAREARPDSVEDPRSTPLGRWMRRTGMDEIPQLDHISEGTMQFVGPRAMSSTTVEYLQQEDPQRLEEHMKGYIPGAIHLPGAFSKNGNANEVYHYNAFYKRKAWLGLDLYATWHRFARPLLDRQ